MVKSPALKKRVGSAVYILPNLLTTGNLFFGFFSIIKSLQGQFGWAAVAILLAGIFDILDGRVARMTHSSSEFGVQYDSLCDLVSFGLAPAFLMFQYGLHELGRLGWMVSFIFLACGALRLARFNVFSAIGQATGDFIGLPIPLAAYNIACFVLLHLEVFGANVQNTETPLRFLAQYLDGSILKSYVFLGVGLLLAVAMVSNFPYRSHKTLKLKGVIRPFKFLSLVVLLFALVGYLPELFGFLLCFIYAISGPIDWLLGNNKLNDDAIYFSSEDEPQDDENSSDSDS